MYTRCPECDTVFRIDRAQLEAADGDVRCGRCSAIFNALENLSEVLRETGSRGQPADDQPPEEKPAGEGLSIGDTADGGAPSAGRTREGSTADDSVLEFSLPEERWGEVFLDDELADDPHARTIVAETGYLPVDVDDDEPTDPRDETSGHATTDRRLDEWVDGREAEEPGNLVEEPDDSEIELYFGSTFPGNMRDAAEDAGGDSISPTGLAAGASREAHASVDGPISGWAPVTQTVTPSRRGGRLLWGLASIMLLVGVVVQLAHMNRDRAEWPWAGELMERAYQRAGWRPIAKWNVNEYRVVAAAVAAESPAESVLRIQATLANTADRAQPYPLIRLTLTDRWGDGISARVFEPHEYIDAPIEAGRLLAPGEPVEAGIAVIDPGEDAFGFELNVCLRDAQRRLQCSDQE